MFKIKNMCLIVFITIMQTAFCMPPNEEEEVDSAIFDGEPQALFSLLKLKHEHFLNARSDMYYHTLAGSKLSLDGEIYTPNEAFYLLKMLIPVSPRLTNVCDENGDTALHIAAMGFPEFLIMSRLAKYQPGLINAENNKGQTVLHILTQNCTGKFTSDRTKRFLLGFTMTMILMLIEENGADPSIKDQFGKEAADYAENSLLEFIKDNAKKDEGYFTEKCLANYSLIN